MKERHKVRKRSVCLFGEAETESDAGNNGSVSVTATVEWILSMLLEIQGAFTCLGVEINSKFTRWKNRWIERIKVCYSTENGVSDQISVIPDWFLSSLNE